jgi:4-amino-4-deoxy-L-arabinose transferase-like glycosyltransferase
VGGNGGGNYESSNDGIARELKLLGATPPILNVAGGGLRTNLKKSPGHVIALGVLGFVTAVLLVILLFNHPYSLGDQPFPDAHEYLNAAYRLAHGHGYTTTVRDTVFSPHARQAVNPPRYPPGTSLVLAPFAFFGSYPGNEELGTRLIVIALVLAVGWAGYALCGWYAAVISALVVALSPFAMINTQIVMSDALAALLIVACVPLMRLRTRSASYVLGVAAGYGVVCRESGLLVVVCILVVVHGRERLRVAVGAVGPIAGLALYNWSTFGTPWGSGYSYWLGKFPQYSLSYVTRHPWPPGAEVYYQSSLALFHFVEQSHTALISTVPNFVFYPLIVLGFSTVFGPPWLTLIGLVTAIRSWKLREARFTVLISGLFVLFYMANFSQDPRLVAGPCILLTIWGVVGLVNLTRALWGRYGEAKWNPDLPRLNQISRSSP